MRETEEYIRKIVPNCKKKTLQAIIGDQNLELNLKNSHGDIIGQEYLQESLINEETNLPSGKPMKIILFPKPENDSYLLSILNIDKKGNLQIFLYDKNGRLRLSKYEINTNKQNKSYELKIDFNKNNSKKTKIKYKHTNINFNKMFENQLKDLFHNFFD